MNGVELNIDHVNSSYKEISGKGEGEDYWVYSLKGLWIH